MDEKNNEINETQKKIFSNINSIQKNLNKLSMLSANFGKREEMNQNVNTIIDEINKVINMLATKKEERKGVQLEKLHKALANLNSLVNSISNDLLEQNG